jgi:hypothetical protein
MENKEIKLDKKTFKKKPLKEFKNIGSLKRAVVQMGIKPSETVRVIFEDGSIFTIKRNK